MGVSTLLSEEEFLNLPEFAGRQELLEGELIELPPAKHLHDELVKRIFRLLLTRLPWERVWTESAYRLSPVNWLIPDASVSWPEQAFVGGWKQGAPMIAVEVASRGNTPDELERKRALYLKHGAEEVWIIYPVEHSMLVSRRDRALLVEADADYVCEALGVTVTPEYRTPIA